MGNAEHPDAPNQNPRAETQNMLEVEDDEARQERISSLLQRLNTTTSQNLPTRPGLKFDFGDRTTFPVPPPIDLLSRVEAFLPQLAASNAELERRAAEDPSSVDIEHIEDETERYIEMNLGLGVFEDRSKRQQGDKETSDDSTSTSTSESSESESSSSEEDEDDTNSSDASGSESHMDAMPSRPIKPLPKRKSGPSQLSIVVLDDSAPKST